MTHRLPIRIFFLILTAFFVLAPVSAQNAEVVARGNLQKKSKSLSGSFTVEKMGDKLVLKLGDNFKAKSGPDLKVVFSPLTIREVNGKNALGRGAVVVAPLKKNKGAQTYDLPASVDLSKMKSVLIHCEKYAVLWGGGSL